MRYMLSQINDVIQKGIQGAKVAGNPIPVFENLDDPNEIVDLNADTTDATYLNEDGEEIDRTVIRWDRSPAIALGQGGRFQFASPSVGFSEDIVGLTKFLFNMIQSKSHIPDHMWAGSDTETEAGVTAKTPPFVRYIENQRARFAGRGSDTALGIGASGGLYELAEIWLAYLALVDRRAMSGSVVLRWSDLTEDDARTKFEWIKWLHSRFGLTTKTALELSNLVENIDSEYEQAQAERATRVEVDEFDDFTGGNYNEDGSPDERGEGADAPRMPGHAGGGRQT
jgi:hypothetical protein